jgi:hypothetical protein
MTHTQRTCLGIGLLAALSTVLLASQDSPPASPLPLVVRTAALRPGGTLDVIIANEGATRTTHLFDGRLVDGPVEAA